MLLRYKGREVEVDQVFGDPEEPQIETAQFTDGEEELLTDEELNELLDMYADEFSQEIYESMAGRAEDLYDLMNDR